jgi:hypothetical protein
MADITVTAAQVLPGTGTDCNFENGIAGATITAGQVVYLDTTNNTYKLADNNDSVATAVAAGVALHGATAGQPLRIQTAGAVTIGAGAAPVAGMVYMLSATPGGIAPHADLTTGNRATILGVGRASGAIQLRLFASQQVRP